MLAAGGGVQTLADAAISLGGSWSGDDTIYFAPYNTSGIWKVSANGGAPQEFTRIDKSRDEVSHRWPLVLPDRKTVMFHGVEGAQYDVSDSGTLAYVQAQAGVFDRRIVWVSRDGTVTPIAVTITPGSSLTASSPRMLFEGRFQDSDTNKRRLRRVARRSLSHDPAHRRRETRH